MSWLCFDLLLIACVGAIFTWHCATQLPASALDGIETELGPFSVLSPMSWNFTGNGLDVSTWLYHVHGGDGQYYSFALEPFLRAIAPLAGVLLLYEVLDVVDFFSDTRRVRRQLQPLNDPMAGDVSADKMATLEQAIARASVDSPTVSTGDQDLRSIEVALNGLLRQMQEAKLQQMRFVSDASHELRTPIAVIQGYVNMLDRWGATDEEVLHESIEALKSESEHMQELVEQLLFLARGDSGRNTLQRIDLNLADIVCEVWDESCMIDENHRYECALTEDDAMGRSSDWGRQLTRAVSRARCRTRASACQRTRPRTSSSASTAPRAPARRAPRARAWDSPSPSGSSTRITAPSRCSHAKASALVSP